MIFSKKKSPIGQNISTQIDQNYPVIGDEINNLPNEQSNTHLKEILGDSKNELQEFIYDQKSENGKEFLFSEEIKTNNGDEVTISQEDLCLSNDTNGLTVEIDEFDREIIDQAHESLDTLDHPIVEENATDCQTSNINTEEVQLVNSDQNSKEIKVDNKLLENPLNELIKVEMSIFESEKEEQKELLKKTKSGVNIEPIDTSKQLIGPVFKLTPSAFLEWFKKSGHV